MKNRRKELCEWWGVAGAGVSAEGRGGRESRGDVSAVLQQQCAPLPHSAAHKREQTPRRSIFPARGAGGADGAVARGAPVPMSDSLISSGRFTMVAPVARAMLPYERTGVRERTERRRQHAIRFASQFARLSAVAA